MKQDSTSHTVNMTTLYWYNTGTGHNINATVSVHHQTCKHIHRIHTRTSASSVGRGYAVAVYHSLWTRCIKVFKGFKGTLHAKDHTWIPICFS